MQFSTILITAMAIFVPSALACNPGQDCCWGGEAGGWKGCMNQHNNILIEDRDARCEQLKPDWCSNQGVTEAQCKADCCSISTGFGKACP
ncbi:hypothetical protein DL95DRAFT_468527 [Leptodontidium sp. 2 PMI_412]|nr:hypothetical protein BKA61DRAFT_683222 [Leptodontidium sp. MPI-SDFR-AT-0119]KAH9207596.1 hypothetical protein DL95DRAFT_468527 [Leptodontidium sp. 2 PMI_412]